jgi:hypothetical protein
MAVDPVEQVFAAEREPWGAPLVAEKTESGCERLASWALLLNFAYAQRRRRQRAISLPVWEKISPAN